jgi:CBS domain-containing protein
MSQQPLPFAENELLPIRVCRTASPAGESTTWFSVYCPRRSGSVALAQCVDCGECEGVGTDPRTDTAYLHCRWPSNEWTADEGARSAEALPAERVSVVSIMSADTICVDPELSLEALLKLFLDHGISGAPVVNKEGRPLGVVSKTDLLRSQWENAGLIELEPFAPDGAEDVELEPGFHLERIREGKVEDIMTPVSFTLSENASVARAAALMAYEGVHRVPVLSGSGQVIGLISALDVTRWVAETSGFCLRGATRPPSSAR